MTPIRALLAALTTVCLAALLGCVSYPVETDYDPEIGFDSLHSYSWLSTTREKTGDPRIDNDLLDRRVRRAVEAALEAKGYRKVAATDSDFSIRYHVGIERQIDVQTYVDTPSYGYRWHGGYSHAYTTVQEYDVGSLILDVIRPNEERLMWRGATQARMYEEGTPEQRDERVQAAVNAILAKFPPSR